MKNSGSKPRGWNRLQEVGAKNQKRLKMGNSNKHGLYKK